jgi:dTDP-4-dehydrorhamnose 3,5-epimerase
MDIIQTSIPGLIVFQPQPHRDTRGYFSRTYDVKIIAEAGLDPAAFVQENQSRSYQGVVRGLHGRSGSGEAKLVRCAHGAVLDVAIDARPDSPTFGQMETFLLDDQQCRQVYIPRGFLHGYQALTSVTDFVYRIDDYYNPDEDLTVNYLDPDLAVPWPAPVTIVSDRDRGGDSWAELKQRLGKG